MKKWNKPRVIIECFVPNEYVSTCSELSLDIDDEGLLFIDYYQPTYYNYAERTTSSGSTNGKFTFYLNQVYSHTSPLISNVTIYGRAAGGYRTPNDGESYSIYINNPSQQLQLVNLGRYDIYIYQENNSYKGFIYKAGQGPETITDLSHNFSSL